MKELICENCGGTYQEYPSKAERSRFCSKECSAEHMRKIKTGKRNPMYGVTGKDHPQWKGAKVNKECKNCGDRFESYESDERVFCSKDCMYAWLKEEYKKGVKFQETKRVELECPECGLDFEVKESQKERRKYCSMECYAQSMKKDYTDDYNKWRKIQESRQEYKEWRIEVFGRDNYTCRICGNEEKLECHHIIPMRKLWDEENTEFVTDVNNGITLCKDCHMGIKGEEMKYIPKFFSMINVSNLLGDK